LTVIKYQKLDPFFESLKPQAKKSSDARAFLIHGERYLCQTALNRLLAVLLPFAKRDLQCEILDGTDDQINEAIQRVQTFSLTPGPKIVICKDAELSAKPKAADQNALANVEKAYRANDYGTAARRLLSMCAKANLDLDRLKRPEQLLSATSTRSDDEAPPWFKALLAYCRQKELSVPAVKNIRKQIQVAVEKGFPGQNYLILTTRQVDRRQKWYKCFQHYGVVLDCSAPTGVRRVDLAAQETLLKEQMHSVLDPNDKLNPAAFKALCAKSGFDPATFTQNLKKIVAYAGQARYVKADDIERLIKRTKSDPIFAFTNALLERDTVRALFLADALLGGGQLNHPLQLLSAMINQVRKLLMAQSFMISPFGNRWHKGMSFSQFQTRTVPAIKRYDEETAASLPGIQDQARRDGQDRQHQQGKDPQRSRSDLQVLRSTQSPYAVFQLFRHAGRFKIDHLQALLARLHVADRRLKSGSVNQVAVLEEVIIYFCQGKGPSAKRHDSGNILR
jgi:DNA polymerase-3 subunit delta